MALRLPDKWLWDFWLAQDGLTYHLFYLQAPRSLEEEELRHWNASIGHAVSRDLRNWELLPDALRPSTSPGWDDHTTWTGSILKRDGLWYMLYTAASRADDGLVQRIGLATSPDLMRWEKHPENPLLEPDPRWYDVLDLELWPDQAWRDPFLFRHPDTGDFHAFITGRVNTGPTDGRGVIAHARSTDLVQWEVLPPLTEPGDFGQLECSQLLCIQGRYYLLFSTFAWTTTAHWTQRTGQPPVTGTHHLVADDPLGPFCFSTDSFLVGDSTGSFYGGRLVQGPDDTWYFLAWRYFTSGGDFVGALSDPMSLTIEDNGDLSVDWQAFL
jgi:beta-fructofuranosidase